MRYECVKIIAVNTSEPTTAAQGSRFPQFSIGEIGWEYVSRRFHELGYAGWIGHEYNPVGNTIPGLAWQRRYDV